jgi:hypothetical protein
LTGDCHFASPPAIFIDPAARALLLLVLSLPGIAARAVHPLLDIVAKEKGIAGLRPVREARLGVDFADAFHGCFASIVIVFVNFRPWRSVIVVFSDMAAAAKHSVG